jgi:hypothetical protein
MHKNSRTFTEWLKTFDKNQNFTKVKTILSSKDSEFISIIFPKKNDTNSKNLNNN